VGISVAHRFVSSTDGLQLVWRRTSATSRFTAG
jgi:hypothetical protein